MNPEINVTKQTKQYITRAIYQYFTKLDNLKYIQVKTDLSFQETKSMFNCAGLSGLLTHSQLHTHFKN